jgi:glycosyltransferase involved in cell wall biosynthesis
VSESIAVACWKSPYPIRGGLDLRIDGICRALSASHEVVLICMEGAQTGKPDYVRELQVAPQRHKFLNHEILRWGLDNPQDPFGIFVDNEQVKFLRNILTALNPKNVIVSRTMMWRLYSETGYNPESSKILDLDESSIRLSRAFLRSTSFGPHIKFISSFHKRNIEYEKLAISQADYVLVSSELEKIECIGDKTPEQILVIENVVHSFSHEEPDHKTAKRVLFPGNFDYPPNREAMKEIVESIAPSLPEFQFTIAGSGLLKKSSDIPNIEYRLNPEEMQAFFLSADFLLAPIRFGAGTRLKVLEAMNFGTVVVATKFAVEGLQVEPGTHYYEAETSHDFITALRRLGEDPALRNHLTHNARKFVNQYHSPEVIAVKLNSIL